MNTVSNNNIAYAIYSATKGKTQTELALVYPNVVRFLAKKRLLSKVPDILFRLDTIINDEEGRIKAKVFSVEKINEITKRGLVYSLSRRYGGKAVALEEYQDEKLLGGFKIEVDDEVIDLTIKNRIGKLQEYLTKSA